MRSSTGEYYVGLDHLRALATFQVFTWHFMHFPKANELTVAPIPFACLGEGHVGVALFMTLSGYIFAKLLSGKDIIYSRFVWNRCVRLLPLLGFVIGLVAIKTYWQGGSLRELARNVAWGWLKPSLPNGGWSITAEFHFYLLLPWMLLLMRHARRWMWLALVVALGARLGLWLHFHTVQRLAFWTIVGRFDQFLLGMYAFELRRWVSPKLWVGVAAVAAWLGYLTWFDALGGYHGTGRHPTLGAIWIVEPTIEAVSCAVLIVWYDQRTTTATGRLSTALAAIGNYSYSIYLLHPFFVFWLPKMIHHHLLDLSNYYVGLVSSLVCFGLAVPIGYLSFTWVESPFLKLRKPYLRQRRVSGGAAGLV